MSNVIAFPVNHPGDDAMLGEIDIALAQERMEDARDEIQRNLAKLLAIQNELGKAGMSSVGQSETANTLLAEYGRA
ncbi:hypothetical protein AB9E06_37205 [Rhizobium leguminosarum]|uniref:hypothetical protein n=1 Tax=Rhizobium leguminosarum TaxID=384 RepID=UPI003F9C59B1